MHRHQVKEKNSGIKAIVGLLTLAGIFLLGWYLWGDFSLEKEERGQKAIGIIEMDRLYKAHGGYAHLVELRQEAADLQLRLRLEAPFIAGSRMDMAEFSEASLEEQSLAIEAKRELLAKNIQERAKALREKMKPVFAEEIEAETKPLLNEMLNLQIKLDNAGVLGLDKNTIDNMLKRLEELQVERDEKSAELHHEQNLRLEEMLAQEAQTEALQLQEEIKSEQDRLRQLEIERGLSIQERNVMQLDSALRPINIKLQQEDLEGELISRQQKISELERKILEDIASRAAKLAMVHKLELILAVDKEAFIKSEAGVDIYAPQVLESEALNLTEEMLEELKDIN